MKTFRIAFLLLIVWGCTKGPAEFNIKQVVITSAAGLQLDSTPLSSHEVSSPTDTIRIFQKEVRQTITGFGGAFTESSAHLLNLIPEKNRKRIIEAYFSDAGARYSLCRTHMNSCDFSLSNYTYAPVDADTLLTSLSIHEDTGDIIPFILEAQTSSSDGFKIIASPWTAPPWMKSNKGWNGGELLAEFEPSWAQFFVKYAEAYEAAGIPIWGFTVENEPLGNGENWESMHFTPERMLAFIKNHLGPALDRADRHERIFYYDQNRDEELYHWTHAAVNDTAAMKFIDGTAVHWYSHTKDFRPAALDYVHEQMPDLHLINTEACIDAEIPHWKDDQWYWSENATDWGYDWAPEHLKKDHPMYVPVERYAIDIIGGLNHWMDGWIDWNMVLDRNGGPNHANNWCIAPVLVDTATGDVYFTPLYHVMAHFSKYIRPGDQVIGSTCTNQDLHTTVTKSASTTTLTLFNPAKTERSIIVEMGNQSKTLLAPAQSLQTIIISN